MCRVEKMNLKKQSGIDDMEIIYFTISYSIVKTSSID